MVYLMLGRHGVDKICHLAIVDIYVKLSASRATQWNSSDMYYPHEQQLRMNASLRPQIQ